MMKYTIFIIPNFINLRTKDFQGTSLFQQKLVFTCIFLTMPLFGLFCHFAGGIKKIRYRINDIDINDIIRVNAFI